VTKVSNHFENLTFYVVLLTEQSYLRSREVPHLSGIPYISL